MLETEIEMLPYADEKVTAKIAFLLVDLYNAEIIKNIIGFDATYIDFKINNSFFTLHEHVMTSISIFVSKDDYTQDDLILLKEISDKVKSLI